MSAPTSGSADGSPAPGYYPDPSIPGYIRYWNGASWVPGTSRRAPDDGESLPGPPPGSGAAASAGASDEPAPQEETGPVFLDEDPDGPVRTGPDPDDADRGGDGPDASGRETGSGGDGLPQLRPRGEMDVPGRQPVADWDDPRRLHGQAPGPATSWQADSSRQSGFGSDADRRISWGSPQADASPRADAASPAARGEQSGTAGAADPATPADAGGDGTGGADASRTAGAPGAGGTAAPASGGPTLGLGGTAARAGRDTGPDAGRDEGTMVFRATRPGTGGVPGARGAGDSGAGGNAGSSGGAGTPGAAGSAPARSGAGAPSDRHEGTMAIRAVGPDRTPARQDPRADGPGRPGAGAGQPGGTAQPNAAAQPGAAQPDTARPGAVPGATGSAAAGQSPAPATPVVPGQPGPGAAPPAGSWPQQVHQLAQPDDGPVTPWRPPVDDHFQQLARAQAGARPAGLGRRFVARLIDGLLMGALLGAAAVPLGIKTLDHVGAKIDEAKLTGETVTVWLLDGTTGTYLGIVLAALLVLGIVYEVLPTAKWGRTAGKKLCGIKVLNIESHDTPSFGEALRRWLVTTVLGLLVLGVVNVMWCLFDRPWRQCWHDKAAGTFVAGD